MDTIYHLADPDDWAASQVSGRYEISTRGRTLADEGFIHTSFAVQWPRVRAAFYGDVVTPLVLLDIAPDRLTSPLMVEVGDHESSEEFPHIYGPLNVDAVLATTILPPPHGR